MKIIHVIGPVGVGKTHFINRKFPQDLTVFDIKIVYEVNQFEPSDLQGNEHVYQQFIQSLTSLFQDYIENITKQGYEIGVCESSGTNAAMNMMLRKHDEYRIWIKPDTVRMRSTYLRERLYAKDLNKYIMDLKEVVGNIMWRII